CCTTVGTPCIQRRYSVLPPTENAWPAGWPTIRRRARLFPPATSTRSDAEFGGGVAASSPRNSYAALPLPAAIEPVAPTPTAATAVRARNSMRNFICSLLGLMDLGDRGKWSNANVMGAWAVRKRVVKKWAEAQLGR